MKKNYPIAISARNITKNFYIPHEKVNSIREHLTVFFRSKGIKNFKVLRKVSFDIKKGEFYGIIGRNGCGKSTLLKILAGIYQPEKGSIKITGKISPFLELGVGFNPELTGRDNVYLNGSVLGLSKKEIKKRYDLIVEFSGLKNFMDTKLKNYSSGMQVRLAFSVAIQAPADIYLVDEALAVGDVEFQEKCFKVFDQLKKDKKTIIFVSHDLASIDKFSDKVIYLKNGIIDYIGSPRLAIRRYQVDTADGQESNLISKKKQNPSQHTGTGDVIIEKVKLMRNNTNKSIFSTGDKITVRIHYYAKKHITNPVFGIAIYSSDGTHITGPNTKTSNFPIDKIKGRGSINYIIDENPLLAGSYQISIGIFDWECQVPYDFVDNMISFKIIQNVKNQYGILKLKESWEK